MVPRAPSLHPYSYTTQHHSAKPSREPSPFSARGNEADDERSSSDIFSDMGPLGLDDAPDIPAPAYPGEDTRPTSKKELLGFYTYSFAAEVFVVCGLGAFIPITLEDLARASATAVLASDHSQPCKIRGIEVNADDGLPHHGGSQCVFKVLGAEINTASFAMYTFSVSVLLQALLVVTMSGAADHGRYRKTLLLAFAMVGSLATMLFLPVTPAVYLFGSLWAIVGNVCFGASFVLLNSFLPLLVRHHPSAAKMRRHSFENQSVAYRTVSACFNIRLTNVCFCYTPAISLTLPIEQ
jgi:MFS transporter, UMF1 family